AAHAGARPGPAEASRGQQVRRVRRDARAIDRLGGRTLMAGRIPLALVAGAVLFGAATYQAEIAQWRRAREAELRGDGSWLTVAGLFWLRDGSNRFGKDASNEVVLPDGPAHAGAFDLRNGKVT